MEDAAPSENGWNDGHRTVVLDAVREARPELEVPDGFADFVRELVGDASDIDEALRTTRLGELCLAFACGEGDKSAIATFEREFDAAIMTSVRRVGSQRHMPEDLAQIVRQRLLVGDKAGIKSYRGRGSLAAWVGVVSMRTALNAVRSDRKEEVTTDKPTEFGRLGELSDPQLDYLRRKYRLDFSAAFSRAAAQLTTRERSLLRQHMLDGLTVRELGRMYSVNSGTISRWITAARARLAELTNQELQANLDVTPQELESILALIASGVELSITRVLGKETQA